MAVSPPLYDLEATVSVPFINRVLGILVAAGKIPTSFTTQGGFREGRILASETHRIDLQIIEPTIFAETGDKKRVGLGANFQGKVTVTVTLEDWKFESPAGTVTDAGLSKTFEVPFDGKFQAIGEIQIVELQDARHAIISFHSLQTLQLQQIGNLTPGPDFTEVIRRIIERIAVVELRLSFQLPNLAGLPASLPAPLEALIDGQSGEIGLVDFEVTEVNGGPVGDDLHILFQSKQDLGLEQYQNVHSRTDSNTDLALTITSNWLSAIQEDFWQGGVIPRHFSDQGQPIQDGPIEVVYLGVTPLATGALRVRLRANRTVFLMPLTAEATLEVRPYVQGQYLKFQVLNENVSFDWAKNTSYAMLFFVFYELLLRPALRGLNYVLQPWIDKYLVDFIQNRQINISTSFAWQQTGLKVELIPLQIPIQVQELGITSHLNITTT